jgi:hypothetical protein
MKYGEERSQLSNTSKYLEANATFSVIEKIWGSLMLRAMWVSFLGIQPQAEQVEYTIQGQK